MRHTAWGRALQITDSWIWCFMDKPPGLLNIFPGRLATKTRGHSHRGMYSSVKLSSFYEVACPPKNRMLWALIQVSFSLQVAVIMQFSSPASWAWCLVSHRAVKVAGIVLIVESVCRYWRVIADFTGACHFYHVRDVREVQGGAFARPPNFPDTTTPHLPSKPAFVYFNGPCSSFFFVSLFFRWKQGQKSGKSLQRVKHFTRRNTDEFHPDLRK